MRRSLLLALSAVVLAAVAVIALRRGREPSCLEVNGHHALLFPGARVFDGAHTHGSDRARADLLLVEGDPTTDVLATRAILRVYERGACAL
jgi:hypothetical protein